MKTKGMTKMGYCDFKEAQDTLSNIIHYANLKCEYGSEEKVREFCESLKRDLMRSLEQIKEMEEDQSLLAKEPSMLDEIKALRTDGPRVLSTNFEATTLLNKMAGAILGRFVGCTLGVPVEAWTIEQMQELARQFDTPFPPTDYWNGVYTPEFLHYGISCRNKYTKSGMDGVPVDDDITYTLIALLTLESYGFDFTTEDVGEIWKKYLPIACTAEEIALENLKKGLSIDAVGVENNPYMQWIGADIRSDGWAYVCAGKPELAAEFAYRDAYLSHRRNGIYGEMFFAATQAAAFCVDAPLEAIEIGLTEIPKDCTLYHDIKWAIAESKNIHNYKQAREAVDKRFAGMHVVHTNNNACLTVFGLVIGNGDFTKTISEIVAMGLDNDCTAATAGSIIGAIVGRDGIPNHWIENFNNTVYTYLKGIEKMELNDIINRFYKLTITNK